MPGKRTITVNKEVAARVRSGKLKWNDPCVACGGDFLLCAHNYGQTMAVISIVNANPNMWR